MKDDPSAEEKTGGQLPDDTGRLALTQVRALIAECRTLVLSTCERQTPWAAPVYYVYHAPGFYFFSSPRSRHIQEGLNAPVTSAALFSDSPRWEDIQGIQMQGVLQEVTRLKEQAAAVSRFLMKFPFARPFLQGGRQQSSEVPMLGDKVRLYRFVPKEIQYTNNRIGFGRRIAVNLEK